MFKKIYIDSYRSQYFEYKLTNKLQNKQMKKIVTEIKLCKYTVYMLIPMNQVLTEIWSHRNYHCDIFIV